MKTVFASAIVALFTLVFSEASAQSTYDPLRLETIDQARQRHSSERYQYQQRYGTPLGGYPEKLGDVAPRGTERPGYTSPKGYGYGGSSQQGTGGLSGNGNPWGSPWGK